MKFKAYRCIQEDCGEICKHESVLDGDRHPKPPEFCPYYGGPCKWEGIDLADEADQPPENLTRDNCFHVSEDGERWTSYLSGPDRWRAGDKIKLVALKEGILSDEGKPLRGKAFRKTIEYCRERWGRMDEQNTAATGTATKGE